MKTLATRSFALLGVLLFASSSGQAATYYFSTSGSNTSGNGSLSSPFYSLCGPYTGAPCKTGTSKISMGQIAVNPGDSLLFRRGDEWEALDAQWSINAAGTAASPITFGAYGDPALPRPKFTGAKTAFALGLDSQWTNVAGTPIWWVPLVYDPQTVAQEETAPDGPQLYGSTSVTGVTNANGWTSDQSMVRGTFTYDWSTQRLYVWRTDNLKPDHAQGRDIYIGQGLWDGSNRLVKVMRPSGVAGGYYVFQDLHVRMSPAYGFSTSYPGTKYINCLSELNGMEGILFDKRRFGAPAPGAKDGEVRNCVVRYNNLQPYHGIGQAITIESENVWIYDSEIYENAWAGIDFLDYSVDTKAEYGGVVNCKVHHNGIHPTMRDNYDPNVYVDGGSHVTIKNCQLWAAGVDPRGVRTRNYANPGVSFDLEGGGFSAGKRPNDLQLINSLVYGNLGPALRIGGINGSQSAVDSLSNIKIIGNTLQRDRGDSDIKSYGSASQADAGQRVVNYGGLTGLVFKNNLVLALNTSRAPVFGSGKTLTVGKSVADFENNFYLCPGCSFDSNGSFNSGGFFSYNYITNATLDQWRNMGATNAALRQDTAFAKSLMVSDPQLANMTAAAFDAHLASASPALDRADGSVFPAGLAGSTQADGSLDQPYNDLGFHYTTTGPVTPPPADTTAPSMPAGLAAVVSGGAAAVTWTPSTDNVGVTGYQVLRDGIVIATTSSAAYTDSTVASGNSYLYSVKAFDAAGNMSAASAAVTLVVPPLTADLTPPTAPSSLAAVLSGSQAQLTWLVAMDNVGVADYQVFNGSSLVTTVTTASYSMAVTAGTTYAFTVKARDAAGNVSPASNTASLTVPAAASNAPANFKAVYDGWRVHLTWSPVATASSYSIYRNGGWWNMFTTTDVYDTGIASGSSYTYKVQANLSNNTSTSFASATVSTSSGADTAAPSVPSALTAAVNVQQVSLSWTASTDNVGVTGYRVYSGSTALGTTASTAYSFTSATNGVTYALSVEAFDAAGNTSARSAAISVTVPDVTAPTQPAGLSAVLSGSDIVLTWQPSTDDSVVSGYKVYDAATLLGAVSMESYRLLNAQSGRTYAFSVVAFDQQGNQSAASAVLSFTVPIQLGAPVNFVGYMSGSSIHLAWSSGSSASTNYEIQKDGVFAATTASLFWDDAAVASGTTYSYLVRAVDGAGNASAWAGPVSVSVAAADKSAPTAPAGLTGRRTADTAMLTWTASTDNVGVAGYNVYSNNALIATTSSPSFMVTGLQPSRTYGFAVKAFDAAGNVSGSSAAFYLTTPSDIQPPTAPVLNVVRQGSKRLLTWTASKDNVGVQGYNIYRGGIYLTTLGAVSTSYTDRNANVVGPISYQVEAYDLGGNSSFSNKFSLIA